MDEDGHIRHEVKTVGSAEKELEILELVDDTFPKHELFTYSINFSFSGYFSARRPDSGSANAAGTTTAPPYVERLNLPAMIISHILQLEKEHLHGLFENNWPFSW